MKLTLITPIILTIILATAVVAKEPQVIELGPGNFAKWSPDGKYLSFVNGEGLALWITDSGYTRYVAPSNEIEGLHDYNCEWTKNDELLFVRKKHIDGTIGAGTYEQSFLAISVDGTIREMDTERYHPKEQVFSQPARLSDGATIIKRAEISTARRIRQLSGLSEVDMSTYYVVSNEDRWYTRYLGTEYDHDIWLIRPDGNPYKRVTHNKRYGLPQLSPNGRYVLCSIGSVVIDLDGNVVGSFGYASCHSWFPDSRRVIYSRITQDEGDVIAGDLYIANFTGENEVQLTNTPDRIELDPEVSPDMTMVAYRNYASDGNHIEILKLGEALK